VDDAVADGEGPNARADAGSSSSAKLAVAAGMASTKPPRAEEPSDVTPRVVAAHDSRGDASVRRVVDSTPSARAPSAARARASSAPRVTPRSPDDAPREGTARTILLAGAAFVGAFVLVQQVVVPALAPHETVEATPTPSALVAAVHASAAPAPVSPLRVEEGALPSGFDPGTGRGLIDIVGQESDALYVDGTFVGRGPGRSVPTPAGHHEVRVVRGEVIESTGVELGEARRIRVTLPATARPRPSR
jgi:hypothetical protein